MKSKIFSVSVLLMVGLVIDYLYSKFGLEGYTTIFDVVFFILLTIVLFVIFVDISYGILFSLKKNFTKSIFFTVLFFVLAMFLTDRYLAISKYWLYSVNAPKRISGNLWQPDKFLAHKGNPNATGYYEYFIGDSISGKIFTSFDSLGFRTVRKENQIKSDTLNLFLGCSFTFGDYIVSEDGYPYKTSRLLDHNFINAGASAYGLGQMIQLVDSLLPKYKFNYVFIQLSPWLAYRAIRFNGPTFYGRQPFPYFSDNDDKSFTLNYPPFNVKKSNRDWRNKSNYLNKIHFAITNGFEEEIINYINFRIAVLKAKFGLINKHTKNKKELEIYFYNYVVKKCVEHNAIPIILKLGYQDNENLALLKMLRENVEVIDLDLALVSDSTDLKNEKRFQIFHLNQHGEKIYYDDHPNSDANTIFSNEIFKTLNKIN